MQRILASALIEELQQLVEEHGDLPVYIRADDYGWFQYACFEKNAGADFREQGTDAIVIG